MRGVSQTNLDLGVLQETNITDVFYTCRWDGYIIVATDVPSRHHSRVVVFYQVPPQFLVEAIQQFVPNVVSFQLDTGEWRWYIIGYYRTPNNASTIESPIAALRERPRGDELLVAGDFNVDLEHAKGAEWDEEIAADLATAGLENIPTHFLSRRHPWCHNGMIWSMTQLGREVWYRTEYILGIDLCIFMNMSVQ